MTMPNGEEFNSNTNGRLSLLESLEHLEIRYGSEFSGARQATRSQLVRFLANALKVAEEAAGRIFDRLQEIGVVERMAEAQPGKPPGRVSEHWRIRNAQEAQAQLLDIDRIEASSSDVAPQEKFAAAEDLLRRAIAARATDIHLDPYADEVEVRFRIDGRLEHFCRLSDLVAAKTIAQFKLMAELDVAEPFEPQEGHLELPLEFDSYAGRVTVVPVAGGEAVAVRLLNREWLVRPLNMLGLTSEQQPTIDELLPNNEGIVLVSGPTGSGKTTTLYSLLYALDDGHRSIVTIEDPIEFRIPAFLQIEVDARHDVTMSRALKTVLRMDPDIIMLGELRDKEATSLAMRAADTGTYVLGTLHARDAAAVITAMRDQQIDQRSFAANLRAVISQRLVRRLCEECSDWRPITDAEQMAFIDAGLESPTQIRYPVGCSRCHGTGYYERIGVFEIAENTGELEEAIKAGEAENLIRRILRRSGIRSHVVDGLEKIRSGITSIEEIRSLRRAADRRSGDVNIESKSSKEQEEVEAS